MHLLNPLLFTTTVLAAAIQQARSTESSLILSDLQALDASVLALKAEISNFTSGNLIDALPIAVGVSNVNLANRKTYLDSLLISKQSVADSKTIVDYVSNPIAIDIPDTVTVLKSKKALLEEAGATQFTVLGLELLKYDHDSLSASLEEKIADEVLAESQAAVKTIDDALADGIAYFSS